MKSYATIFVACLLCLTGAHSGNIATLNAGGGRSAGAGYALEASLNDLPGGVVALPAAATNLVVSASPSPVSEGGTSQLTGTATMDDATTTVLTGSDIAWSVVIGPIASLDSAGIAHAGVVYANTPAAIQGRYLDAAGLGTLTVLETNPDNFGAYGGDGLPDPWQVQFFGTENAKAAPDADPDGDGQNNQFEYAAGLVPTNPASLFVLRIESVPTLPRRKRLIFSPRFADRTYTPEFRTDSGSYTTLTGITTGDRGNERVVIDLNAIEPVKLYRVKITYP